MRCEATNVKHICHTALVSVLPPLFEPPRPCDYEAGDLAGGRPELAPPETSHSDGAPAQKLCKSRCSSACLALTKKLGPESVNDNAPGEPDALMSERKNSSIVHKTVTKEKYKDKEKRLKNRKRKYDKSHLIYYTHTDTKSPFNLLDEAHDRKQTTYQNRKNDDLRVDLDGDYSVYNNNRDMNESYVSNMVRRQYEHYPMGAEISDTSEFSTPVCRDAPYGHSPKHYESDMCSCCHGPFHDVDDSMRLPPHGLIWDTTPIHGIRQYAQQIPHNNVFYDSSLYDVVPVKETPMKQKRDENVYITQDPKRFATRDVCSANTKRAKSRKQHNYHNVAPLRVIPRYYTQKKKIYSKLATQRKESISILPDTRKKNWKRRDTPRASEVSAVVLSPVYTRPNCIANIAKVPVQVKHVECLTTNVNNSECQTASTKSVQLEAITIDENKTEATLNQIKTILQSVLTEVKTNSQIKGPHERISKKDAVVQKDQSQNNMQTAAAPISSVQPMQDTVSSFMNSYSYSPYNLRPYGPSCSRLLPSSQLAPPLSPFQPKCMHNYPLFIQTTGRQCACCFRSIPKGANTTGSALVSHASPLTASHPPPATIATNTEQHSSRDLQTPSRSPETDKLIQEIYKSIAVNMDYFNKNSTSDFNDLKSSNPSRKTTEMGLPSINERKKQVGMAIVHRQSNMLTSDHSKSVVSPALVSKTTLSTPRHSHRIPSFVKESSETVQRELVSLRRRGGLLVRSSSSQSDSSTLTSNVSDCEKTVTGVRFEDQVRN